MASVSTMADMWRPLMDAPSIETRWCAVCGRTWPLNRHHMVARSAGKLYRDGAEVPKPTIVLCGSGNASGCHGLAHQHRLHFRWNGERVEYLLTSEPVGYLEALDMDGWRPVRS